MDVSLGIRHRLNEVGLEQIDLANAAQVTESYISQLATGKRHPLRLVGQPYKVQFGHIGDI
jgi:predicted transcriptional regulator